MVWLFYFKTMIIFLIMIIVIIIKYKLSRKNLDNTEHFKICNRFFSMK